MSQPYSQEDFELNPGKYRLFRTAEVAEPIRSSPHLSVGQVVGVSFHDIIHNVARDNLPMPVYRITTGGDEDGTAVTMLFACALTSFGL